MPQSRKMGTAWDRSLDDYGYTRELDRTGWAWEFLRRNEDYRMDCRMNRAGHPVAIRHMSGATIYRPRRRFLAAETWGLVLFANPDKTALEADIFWLPNLTTYAARCHARPANDNVNDILSLASFRGRRAVLAGFDAEQIVFQGDRKSASLIVQKGSLLFGNGSVTFFHDGLSSLSRHYDTLKILNQLASDPAGPAPTQSLPDSKYRDYLVALDGRLDGRSYRDIAEVLYGPDRVGAYWTDDTRGLKSRIRRAVESGLSLMKGGYRELL